MSTWVTVFVLGLTPFVAEVTDVADCDTMRVRTEAGVIERIRLSGVDCPELRQRHGPEARAFVLAWVGGQTVRVIPVERDRYGRLVADVEIQRRRLSHAVLRAGWGWWYFHFSGDARLARLEAEARIARRGLWADPHPTPPWVWRRIRR